jgi:hypothetical protein
MASRQLTFPRFSRLAIFSLAAVWLSACGSPGPVEPSRAHLGGAGALERRVDDVGGVFVDCVADPDRPPCPISATVTLVSKKFGTVVLLCQTPRHFDPPTIDQCQVMEATGRFAGAMVFDFHGTPDNLLRPFHLVDSSALEVELGLLILSESGKRVALVLEGTLRARVNFINAGDCQIGSQVLDVEFRGTLSHLGEVSGTITAVCEP